MFVLFDIDGTLLDAGGRARQAIVDAGRGLFGDAFSADGVDFAGRLDGLIIRDLLLAARVVEAEDADGLREAEAAIRAAYARNLERVIGTVRALPGTAALVDALHAASGVDLGLVTGNYPETGTIKIRAAGFEPARFTASAWGSDGGHRRELPPLAVDRLAEATGRRVAGEQVVVIGDTPHDVDCAKANGCRVIAVGTGPSYSEAELRDAGPDLFADDLSDTRAILDWILRAA